MDDPIKIIHKYKNTNRRVQYHIYIFVGDIFDDGFYRILDKFKDLDLYTTLTTLEMRDIDKLVKVYGDFWYEKFFNISHINFIRNTTISNTQRSKELKSIYGDAWYTTHFSNYKKHLQTINYSFESVVRDERERKVVKKIMYKPQLQEDDILDYTTRQTSAMSRVSNNYFSGWCAEESSEEESSDDDGYQTEAEFDSIEEAKLYFDRKQKGGDDEGYDIDPESIDDFPGDFDNLTNQQKEEQELNAFDEMVEQEIDDLEAIYGNLDTAEETDKNIRQTTKEIKQVISNEVYNKITDQVIEFDQSNDNSMFDENLKDAYQKYYVKNQYIYKDDSIRVIKNKICSAFKNNNKFGEDTYIIPSYQYIWSEYLFNGKFEKVMIGQKWIVKNDILKMDVEPNTNLAVYEDLRGNLKQLRDNIRRQGKIKREDDEYNILTDYDGFYTNNELFMIDIYNELGKDYDPTVDDLRNLYDVYIRIYYPKIKPEEIKNIIDVLHSNLSDVNKSLEKNRMKSVFNTINNDLMIENRIMRDIELVKKNDSKQYPKLFKQNYITQSVIRVYLNNDNRKVDLFRIFDNFELNSKYPFIQFQPLDGIPTFRYNEKYMFETKKKDIIIKWFENSPYGISFKVKIKDKTANTNDEEDPEGISKYMAINLTENGRIDYKIQWKEDDRSTIDDIHYTYKYIQDLVEKINHENNKYGIHFKIPKDYEFKFAFFNTIQGFELPKGYDINHNDLSEFSRYFYPYVALVIDPRKRQSKTKGVDKEEKSKFGTYLRYKRISNYENKTKIEHRIIFFMKNYEYDDQSLANEIGKEFNITEEQAVMEINNVREKYPNVKKSRRVLKKMENIPKYKPPGIGIDIQGKDRENYKIRIAGARGKDQLDRIITFMNILIYLYVETYLLKKPDRQKMKEYLNKLTKIAKRRNKVEEIVDYDKDVKNVKKMSAIDKRRIGYKPEEGQNQWTRACQNSGDDKKRQPQYFEDTNQLIKLGYTWNADAGFFERPVMVDEDGNIDGKKKKSEVILRAIKLPLNENNDEFIYYTCNPEENGKHMYIGFLGRSSNPFGEAMPCCFIKDQFSSKNKKKRDFFLRSVGVTNKEEIEEEDGVSGDVLYILQDTNKIQEGRLGFLPRYLDVFMNLMIGNTKEIDNHYLLSTKPGYYFKYGPKQEDPKYLSAIASMLDTEVNQVRKSLIKCLDSDKDSLIFTSLANGDIRTQFRSQSEYIDYIRNSESIDYELVNDLISIPGALDKNGINIIIIQKKIKIIKKDLDKEKITESYYIVCQNPENTQDILDPSRENIIIMKDGKNYYPIVRIVKEDEENRDIEMQKTFHYADNDKNIIHHIYKYYEMNCKSDYSLLIKEKNVGRLTAKQTQRILSLLSKEFNVKSQIIDARFKCKYLVTNSGLLIPVLPSGSLYNVPIAKNIDLYVKDFDSTIKDLNKLMEITKELMVKPIGIYYSDVEGQNYIASSIILENTTSVPIQEKKLSKDFIKKNNYVVENKSNDEYIDREILKGPNNIVVDERIQSVKENEYTNELYQLFRLHLSHYLASPEGDDIKNKIQTIIDSKDISKKEKRVELKRTLYRIINKDLLKRFNTILEKQNLKGGEWIHVQNRDKKINFSKYVINNKREVCYDFNDENVCNASGNCHWSKDQCSLNVREDMLIDYVNKIVQELVQNDLKADEIMQKGEYSVSNIVDYNVFTERPGEKLIKTSRSNVNNVLEEVFGKDNIPKIGKRRNKGDIIQNHAQLNIENPLKEIGPWYIQNIIQNNNTIFRAFANGHYWLIHPYSDLAYRNLGYYNSLQTQLANIYKSQVVDWLLDPDNNETINTQLMSYSKYRDVNELAVKISIDVETLTNGIVELFVLSKLYSSIIRIYDENNKLTYFIHPENGILFDVNKNKKEFSDSKYASFKKNIYLRLYYSSTNVQPERVEVLYPRES